VYVHCTYERVCTLLRAWLMTDVCVYELCLLSNFRMQLLLKGAYGINWMLVVIFTFAAPGRGAKYCDLPVWLSVSLYSMSVCLSLRSHISKTACRNFTKFCVHVTYDRGLVLP